ncbi:6062_t:CDS:2 [Entrophospora sp. SA101]|nr:6062_t:CDS:2 [Entrophospora sp. SA101]
MDPLDWSIANLGKKLKNQLAGLALQPKLVIDEPCRCIREAEFGVWNKKSFLTAFANKADNYQYIIDIYEQSNEEIELVEKKEKRKSLNDELGKFSKNVSTYVDVIVLDTSRNIGFSGVPFKTKVLLQSTTVSFIGGFAFLTMADVEMSSSDYVEEESVSGKKKVMNLY